MTESEAIRELEWAKNRLMQCSHMDNNRMKSFNMAIKALEKQIPKKTVNYSRVDNPNDIVACCPICDGNVDWTYNGNWRKGNPKYCKNCGQKLDWE